MGAGGAGVVVVVVVDVVVVDVVVGSVVVVDVVVGSVVVVFFLSIGTSVGGVDEGSLGMTSVTGFSVVMSP